MNGLTRHIRLEQPVMISADLRSAAPRPGRPDAPLARRHPPARHAYPRRAGFDQDHCEWRRGVRPGVG